MPFSYSFNDPRDLYENSALTDQIANDFNCTSMRFPIDDIHGLGGVPQNFIVDDVCMDLIYSSNSVHLIPSSDIDAVLLARCSVENYPNFQITVRLMNIVETHDILSSHEERIQSEIPENITTPLSHQRPKHIYVTSSETYRVQVGKRSKNEPNGKFSRNARNELDALWICEIALIGIDRPLTIDDAAQNGNYEIMQAKGIVESPFDLLVKLVEKVFHMKKRSLIKDGEADDALNVLHRLLPAEVIDSIISTVVLSDDLTNSQVLSQGGNVIRRKKRKIVKQVDSSIPYPLDRDILSISEVQEN